MSKKFIIITTISILLTFVTITTIAIIGVKYLKTNRINQRKNQKKNIKNKEENQNQNLKTKQDLAKLNQEFIDLLNKNKQSTEKLDLDYDSYYQQLQQELKNKHLNIQKINDLFYQFQPIIKNLHQELKTKQLDQQNQKKMKNKKKLIQPESWFSIILWFILWFSNLVCVIMVCQRLNSWKKAKSTGNLIIIRCWKIKYHMDYKFNGDLINHHLPLILKMIQYLGCLYVLMCTVGIPMYHLLLKIYYHISLKILLLFNVLNIINFWLFDVICHWTFK